MDVLPAVLLDFELGLFAEAVAEVYHIDGLELLQGEVLAHHVNILLQQKMCTSILLIDVAQMPL